MQKLKLVNLKAQNNNFSDEFKKFCWELTKAIIEECNIEVYKDSITIKPIWENVFINVNRVMLDNGVAFE